MYNFFKSTLKEKFGKRKKKKERVKEVRNF